MDTTTAASSGRWSDLPCDLLRDISRRLYVATDYVRFHAVCKAWRDAHWPPACRPALLPWLLARRDDTGHRKARCVFSSTGSANGQFVRDPERAIVAATCCRFTTAATCPAGGSESNGFADAPLIIGSATTTSLARLPPPYPDEMKPWVNRARGMVSGDGTVFLYAFGRKDRRTSVVPLSTALLRPGDAVWRTAKRNDLGLSPSDVDGCCVAYHDGKVVVLCRDRSSSSYKWTIVSAMVYGNGGKWSGHISGGGGHLPLGYLVESRGELLYVLVHVDMSNDYYRDAPVVVGERRLSSLPDKVWVSVHVLQFEGGEPRWVERDGRSFADRILFLGQLGSFAMDAAPFHGVGGGGCAYFIDRRLPFSVAGSKLQLDDRCRVYKYSFLDGSTELVEQLPADWNGFRCMWLSPQPAIASSVEIGAKLRKGGPSHSSSSRRSCFTIYVGNLAPKVDSRRLRQFFSKHGKVTGARVVVDGRTRRSRGFGFVTMENTAVLDGDEPAAHAVAKLHGQCWDGRPLVVKMLKI